MKTLCKLAKPGIVLALCFWGLACLLLSGSAAVGGAPAPQDVEIAKPTMDLSGELPDVPVVFVSRNRLSTWNRVHIGPAVDVLGREITPGGRLMLWRPGGTVADLTGGTGLFDVQQPDVSYDGTKAVFSAATEPRGQWRLWEIGLDGSGLRQLTFDDRDIPIPDDPRNPGRNQAVFGRYGDFGPVYLPDGRIMFSSTRYMTLSGSCGQRGQNLYVLDPETGEVQRRTTERAGGMDPFVMRDGRILFSHWIDAANKPADHGGGLRPLETEYSFSGSSWALWAMNPDAGAAGRYAFLRGGLADGGGACQPHELPDGDVVVSFRGHASLLGDTLATAVTVVTPGLKEPRPLTFLGNPYEFEADHALAPAPLPDGRIAVSYTPFATVETDGNGIRSADFDFGLYVADRSLDRLVPLYNDENADELDPVAAGPRVVPPVIPDGPDADLITDDPTVDLGTTAMLINRNVYADLPIGKDALPSPRVKTVSLLQVYDDSQTFETSEEFPLLKRQMPRLVGSYPVGADGGFSAEVPADKALLFVLTDAEGVAVRSPMSLKRPDGPGRIVVHTFNGHDYLRPGAEMRCAGCHKGHMADEQAAMEAKTNLSRIAEASASSEPRPFFAGAWRAIDLRPGEPSGAFGWATDEGPGAWLQLDWLAPVKIESISLYPYAIDEHRVVSGTLSFSDGFSVPVENLSSDGTPWTVELEEKRSAEWIRFTVDDSATRFVGIAEIAVNGPPEGAFVPDVAPSPPVDIRCTDGFVFLTWNQNPERIPDPQVAGYKIYLGTEPGVYDRSLDVGNVTRFVMRDLLEDGRTYYIALKSYNVYKTESENFSEEVSATIRAPEVLSVEPNRGPVGGGTPVVIKGRNFAPRGVMVKIGGEHARNVRVLNEGAIAAETHWHGPGAVDVVVTNPDDQAGVLAEGFLYEKPGTVLNSAVSAR